MSCSRQSSKFGNLIFVFVVFRPIPAEQRTRCVSTTCAPTSTVLTDGRNKNNFRFGASNSAKLLFTFTFVYFEILINMRNDDECVHVIGKLPSFSFFFTKKDYNLRVFVVCYNLEDK